MSARVKNIIKIAGTFLLIAVCAVVPNFVPFAGGGLNNDPVSYTEPPISAVNLLTDPDAKIELYNKYSQDTSHHGQLSSNEIDPDDLDACYTMFGTISENFDIDRGEDFKMVAGGELFYTIADDNGSYIRVVEYYRQWVGDWSSWLRVYTDADTQEIYYVFTSCDTLKNFNKYSFDKLPNSNSIALLLENNNLSMIDEHRKLLENKEIPEGSIYSYYRADGSVVSYFIDGSTSMNPDSQYGIFDYKVYAQPGRAESFYQMNEAENKTIDSDKIP